MERKNSKRSGRGHHGERPSGITYEKSDSSLGTDADVTKNGADGYEKSSDGSGGKEDYAAILSTIIPT